MRHTARRDISRLALLSVSLLACGGEDYEPEPTSPPGPPGGGERAIAEADIIQIDDGRLYAMSRSGSLSVVDVSRPGRLTLLGRATLPGEPFEMYRREGYLFAMSNTAVGADGIALYGPRGTDPNASALVIVLDVRNPADIRSVATLSAPGQIADSRIVGDVLYLATYENSACFGCGPAPRTMVTTFDVADPRAMAQVDQAIFQSNAPDGYNLPWGSNWKRSIFVTQERLYIGGHADIAPESYETEQPDEGIIDVLDITDPRGRLGRGARLVVAGAILSRWQLDERDGVLRVISQRGAGRTGNGLDSPVVDTFRVDSALSFAPLGHMEMRLPMQEGLRTVRFDGDRAYAITYNQTDPLFVIDLSVPEEPVQRGELEMPGFMFYLEPYGDRVIGLGIDRTDPEGSLNVSLFDVADPDAPRMIRRVSFATAGITEDYAILDSEVVEDQDRIQKAFRVFPDGLVAVPFAALRSYAEPASCDNTGGGVQLIDWSDDTLIERALLPVPGTPRRAFENNGEMVAVSDSNVRSFSLARTDAALQTADLVIDTCTPESINPYGNDGGEYDEYDHQACSAAGGGGGWGTLLALLALCVRLGTGRARRWRRGASISAP